MSHEILVVDDQQDIRQLLSDILKDEGYTVRTAADSHEALDTISHSRPQLVILDIWLNNSRFDGIEILDIIRQNAPTVPVVMMSGHGNIETAVSCLQKGAYDFIEKPFRTDRLLSIVAKGIEIAKLQEEVAELRRERLPVETLTGGSPAISLVKKTIQKVAQTNSRVLIEGAPGTGKAVVARLIHQGSARASMPFITVNCGALDGPKLSETLFGAEHNIGRADYSVTTGLLEKANGGTLYLDNVYDLPLDVQAKVLHVLHDQKFCRVGGTRPIEVNVRIVSSSSQSLQRAIAEKRFREDLYYRLNVVPVMVPSLRERVEDIPPLVEEFIARFCQDNNRPILSVSPEAMAILQAYQWPGNVRQLRNIIEWVIIMAGDGKAKITGDMLPAEIQGGIPAFDKRDTCDWLNLPLREAREQFERDYLSAQVARFGGNVAKTAESIGMERTALHRKMKSLGLVEKEQGVGQ